MGKVVHTIGKQILTLTNKVKEAHQFKNNLGRVNRLMLGKGQIWTTGSKVIGNRIRKIVKNNRALRIYTKKWL